MIRRPSERERFQKWSISEHIVIQYIAVPTYVETTLKPNMRDARDVGRGKKRNTDLPSPIPD